MDKEAILYAQEVVKKNSKTNPCGNCEAVDCEGCEYFDSE